MQVGNSGGTLRFPFPRRSQRRVRAPGGLLPFIERRFTPRTVFMEIGSADSELALQAASFVERVYAVDVSGDLLQRVLVPCNLRIVVCDGVRIPVPEESVDLAWSGAFMDRLHPYNARDHLQSVLRSLTPGGEYACTSSFPARTGARMLAAGFASVRLYAGAFRLPWSLASLVPRQMLRIVARKP